jgi:FkbM family methyltransferase
MNWRYLAGASVSRAAHFLLSRPYFPPLRAIPYNWSVCYDIKRFAPAENMSIIFDVGANIGQSVDRFRPYFPNALIHCFEPSKSAYETLRSRYEGDKLLFSHNIAIGSEDGEKLIYISTDSSELNTFIPNSDSRFDKKENVKIKTIDSIITEFSINLIDILKIDVQGWEPAVLQGAANSIIDGKIKFVFIECGFNENSTEMTSISIINSELMKNGFKFCGIYDQFRWGDKREVYFANALYMHKSFMS